MVWSDYFPFLKSPALKAITDAIDTLLANVGSGTPDNWYNTVAEIRALTSHADSDDIGLYPATKYSYDPTETAADDGDNYIKPDDVSDGRWVKQVTFSVTGHNHTDKLDKPTGENLVPNSLYTVDTEGNLVALGVSIDAFVRALEGYGLSQNNFSQDYIDAIAELYQLLDTSSKIDKIEVTTGNENNLVVLGEQTAEGRGLIDTGLKLSDIMHVLPGGLITVAVGESFTIDLLSYNNWYIAEINFAVGVSGEVAKVFIEVDAFSNINKIKPTTYIEGLEISGVATANTSTNIITITITVESSPASVIVRPAKILYL